MKQHIFSFTIVRNNKCSSRLNPEYKPGPVSVMELLRPKDRERILNICGPSTQASQNASTQAVPSVSSGLQQEALAAWKGTQTTSQTFRPFEKNPSKQARYDMYLTGLKQGDKGKTVRLTGSHSLTVCLALTTKHCWSTQASVFWEKPASCALVGTSLSVPRLHQTFLLTSFLNENPSRREWAQPVLVEMRADTSLTPV